MQRKASESRRQAIALVCALALITTLFGSVAAQQKQQSKSALTEEQRIVHILNRLGFGARPGDIERVKSMGIENYINQQLNPEKISDAVAEAKIKNLATLSMTTAQLYEKYPQPGMLVRQLERRGVLPADLAEARRNMPEENQPAQPTVENQMQPANPQNPSVPNNNPQANQEYRRAIREYYAQNGLQLPQRIIAELQASRILRAVYSERQLQEVMVDFWSNHFNVFAGKGADRWLLVSYDRDTIRPHAMGKFSDLLTATAQSPAMLFYLDNFQSVSPNAPQGRRVRPQMLENFPGGRRQARGLLNRNGDQQADQMRRPDGTANPPQQPARRGINENYARELMELHTLGVDGGYSQKDVQEVARCFTGWTIFAPRGAGAAQGRFGDVARERAGTFFFNPRVHDDGEKTVLGHKIPSGGGFKDGSMVLDILAKHPSTARFISQKLVRYFVSDNPSPALVTRVADVFTKSGGDIRETLKAIFLSPEFNSPDAYRAKVKRPFELAISAVRTLGGDTTGGPQFHQWITRMGEPLYGFQTPNGYSDSAESWVNTGGLLERLNFGLALASNRIPGTRVDLKRFVGETNNDKREVMDRFLNVIIAGDISQKTKETLLKQLSETEIGNDPQQATDMQREAPAEVAMRPRARELGRGQADVNDPASKIVGLILGSPEFQKQ